MIEYESFPRFPTYSLGRWTKFFKIIFVPRVLPHHTTSLNGHTPQYCVVFIVAGHPDGSPRLFWLDSTSPGLKTVKFKIFVSRWSKPVRPSNGRHKGNQKPPVLVRSAQVFFRWVIGLYFTVFRDMHFSRRDLRTMLTCLIAEMGDGACSFYFERPRQAESCSFQTPARRHVPPTDFTRYR